MSRRSLSVKFRTALIAFAIAILGIWYFAYFSIGAFQRDLQKVLGDEQLASTRYIAKDIDQEFLDRIEVLSLAAGSLSGSGLNDRAMVQKFIEGRRAFSLLFPRGVFVVDKNGVVAASDPLLEAGKEKYRNSDFYRQAIESGKPAFGKPFLDGSVPMMILAVPIPDEKGKRGAVFAGRIALGRTSFFDIVAGASLPGSEREISVVSPADRRYIASSDPELSPLSAIEAPLFSTPLKEESRFTSNRQGRAVLASFATIPSTGWEVVISMPKASALYPVEAMKGRIFEVATLLSFMMAVGLWYVMKRMLAPLGAASMRLRQMTAEGAPLEPVAVERFDEIGELLTSFNILQARLSKKDFLLNESKNRYLKLFEEATDAIVIADAESGEILDLNHEMERLTGWERADLIGRHQKTLHPPEERSAPVSSTFERHREENEGDVIETLIVTREGELKDVAIKASRLELDGRKTLLGFFRDITRQKNAEKELVRQRNFMRLVIDADPSRIHVKDDMGNFLLVNRALADAHGMTPQEMVGKNMRDINPHQEEVERYLEVDREVISTRREIQTVEPSSLGGSKKWFITLKKPLELPDGSVNILGISLEITERKEAEEQLHDLARQLEERVAALSESEANLARSQRVAHLGNWMWDLADGTLSWSDETYRIFGLTPQSVAPDFELFMNYVHPEDRENVGGAVNEALSGEKPYAVEFRIAVEGSEKFIKAQGEVSFDEGGKPLRMFGTILDVSIEKRTESELRKWWHIFEHAEWGVAVVDREGKFTLINPSYARMHGYEVAELVGRPAADVFPEDSRADFTKNFNKLRDDSKAQVFESWHVRKDGTLFPVRVDATVIRDEQGVVRYNAAHVKDISDERKSREKLRLSEERFRSLVETSFDCIWEMDKKSAFTYASPKGQEIFGEELAAILGKKLEEFLPPEDRDAFASLFAARRPFSFFETPIVNGRGERIVLEMSGVPVSGADGKFLGFRGTGRDITARKEAEAALLRLNRLYATLSETNQAIVRTRNMQRLLQKVCEISVSKGLFRMAWVGMPDEKRAVVPVAHAGYEEGYLGSVKLVLGDGKSDSGPTGQALIHSKPYICSDIETDPVMVPWRNEALARGYLSSAVFPLRENGKPVGAIAFYAGEKNFFSADINALLDNLAHDISFAIDFILEAQKRGEAEAELGRLNSELEERVALRTRELAAANRELEAFSYSVSHDLRAPLRSISGFSQLLVKKFDALQDGSGKDYLDRVIRASQRMGDLIDDLLKLSQVSRAELQNEEVDLSEMAKMVMSQLAKTAPERRLRFEVQEGLMTMGDSRLIRVALENLLGNAWKFTAKKPEAVIEFLALEGEKIFHIRDNGAGFKMEYAKKLFGPFQRLHSERDFEGTGIGLATVQRIVNRHGGKIWCDAAPEKGASFYFTLSPEEEMN